MCTLFIVHFHSIACTPFSVSSLPACFSSLPAFHAKLQNKPKAARLQGQLEQSARLHSNTFNYVFLRDFFKEVAIGQI